MKNIIEKDICTGCMACKNICPKQAIEIKKEKDGFLYPIINEDKCVHCGLCEKVCPVINKLVENNNETEVYACKNKNDDIRMKSSSGGAFSLIAEYILSMGGIVFGAKFNEKLEVVHDYIESTNDLDKFRGSKYVQSQIGDCYKKVKEFLLKNRKVLFTGTPCQIEGLLSYLQKDYDNLYTQDIICHGVPSPKVWKRYIEYRQKKVNDIMRKVNFRKKDILGWNQYQTNYMYQNKEENMHHDDDPYMKFFLRNFDLRKSCYDCHFKKIKRNSDITVADFWGINQTSLNIYDEKGISALIIHTKKGKEIFEHIKQNMDYSKADIEDIINHNSCIVKSTYYNEKREEFFEDLENKAFEELIEKYLKN